MGHEVHIEPDEKLFVCEHGNTHLDIIKAYSEYKEWLLAGDNAKYLPAYRVVGGDPTIDVNKITPYFFLLNGWRIRPHEANHTLEVDGIILVDGGGDPFVQTIGGFNVNIRSIVPVHTETVQINTGSGLDAGQGQQLTEIHRAHFNKRDRDPGSRVITIYDSDGVTPLHEFDSNDDMSAITPR